MTANIFEKWIPNVDKCTAKEYCKIAMFIENCPAHTKRNETLKNIIGLCFFPPNMTSKLQPLDQGIKEFQSHYHRILKKILMQLITINQ